MGKTSKLSIVYKPLSIAALYQMKPFVPFYGNIKTEDKKDTI